MELFFERDAALQTLGTALQDSLAGQGRVVLVSGEAGIGKTTLIEHFSRQHHKTFRILRGASDPLLLSHPFCALHDMVRQLPDSKLGDLVWDANQLEVLYYFLELLQETPTIVIFEDIHWADEATLSLLSFLCRRLNVMQCMMIVTYRDDELSLDHPLRPVLGHLTGPHVQRLHLQPLTEQTVVEWVKLAGKPAEGVYEATGGNPFYITEMLASGANDIPHSVSEAVLARMAPLSSDARNIVEIAALIPKERFAFGLLKSISDVDDHALDEAVSSGILRLEDDLIVFRHDLARHAVIDAMTSVRYKLLNVLILQTLIRCYKAGDAIGVSQIVHHARMVDDLKLVVQFAPLAAQEALRSGAHREAVAYYRMVLEHAESLTPEEHGKLLEDLSYECYLTGQIDEAIQYRQQALTIWQQQDRFREGVSHRWLSRLHWFSGENEKARRAADQAIEILEMLPPDSELAMAYSNRAQLHMLAWENAKAIEMGRKAIALAEQFGCTDIVGHALNNVGMALLQNHDPEGEVLLKRSLKMALEHGFDEHAARAYTNLVAQALWSRNYAVMSQYLDEGIEYSLDRDLHSWSDYMQGYRARVCMETGKLDEAAHEAEAVIQRYRESKSVIQFPALLTLAHTYVRQGHAAASTVIDEAQKWSKSADEYQRIMPLLAITTEHAWNCGDQPTLIEDATAGYDLALQHQDQWMSGYFGWWLWRAGESVSLPEYAARPYVLQIAGDWQSAADLWAQIGAPYEQAMALADGDSQAQQTALTMFEALGAKPAAEWLRQKMRSNGIPIPRGPREETLDNPGGLTSRQLDVLALLVEGFSDNEIADRLVISPKTAGHHVSSILSKLNVRTRQEAAIVAIQNAWFSTDKYDSISSDSAKR